MRMVEIGPERYKEPGFRQRPILTGLGVKNEVAEVIIQESESLENALRRFKRKVQQEDIIK